MVLPYEDRPAVNYGVGENYLRFCAFADPLSPRLITGISQLLAGQIDCVSIIYPRRSAMQNTSFMLFGFPYAVDGSRAALLHIDITSVFSALIQNRSRHAGPGAAPEGGHFAEAPGPRDLAMVATTLESSVLAAIAATREPDRLPLARLAASAEAGDERQPPLSKRQWQVLSLMTNGLTNVEIARQLGLSPNTVKIHVSGILARLGLPSRTQAVHWALTQGRPDKVGDGPERS
ncbi:MAG: response regulator transcription factor [Rhodoplanes sp.]|nr:response regulator transcription factor [Rhodoplanes sp.]